MIKVPTKIKPIYQDSDVALVEHVLDLQDTTDNYRTLILNIGDKQFGFEFAFGKLIHTWEKRS